MSGVHQLAAKTTEQSGIRTVVVCGSAAGFAQEILAGPHRMTADEPLPVGGTDTGPPPYDFYSPPWGLARRSPFGCTLAGKDGRSRKLLSIYDTRGSTPPIAPSAKPDREYW